jgi:hypothetical protein
MYYHGIGNWLGSLFPPKAKDWPIVGKGVTTWLFTKEHLALGCLNPAMILDAKKGLVAVFTNLNASGERSVPVIQIYSERIDLIPGKVRKGDLFATACVYLQSHESRAKGQWCGIDPIIVDCLVTDRNTCRDAAARISPLAWQALEIGLSQVPDLTTMDIHYVDVPHDIVWNAY